MTELVKIPNTPIRFIIHVSKPFKWWAFGAIFAVVVASVLSQSTALFFKLIIDAVESGDKSDALFFGLLFPCAILVVQLLYRASGFFGLKWITSTKKYSNDLLFGLSTKQSHTYFSNRFSGSLLNKMRNVIGGIDNLVADFLWSYTSTVVSLLVTLYFISVVSPRSGLVFGLLIVTLIIFNRALMPSKQRLSKNMAASSTKLSGSIVDVFSNISAVRQFSRRQLEQETVGDLSERWLLAMQRSAIFTEKTIAYNAIILFGFSFLMFYYLVVGWQQETISTGDFVFILALVSQLTGTLVFIGKTMTNYARVMGEMEEGLEDMLVEYEIVDGKEASPLEVTKGTILWQGVSFEFGENKVFQDFNLDIKSGQRIGLVGSSGAGKTTFVSLLLRQHELTGGAILLDGQNIAAVTQDSLREHIAIVPQEPMLFHRTIKENIAYGMPTATDEDIIAVAKKAQAHDFIVQLEKGYDTLVGERGIKLSGGQKQRVAIARAMLKDAPILILDEATSALDSESEVAIQTALHELMVGKTVVAIAHRLSTLREMDRIIVLGGGKIIEDGTHEQLKDAGGVYQRLWQHQAGGFMLE